MFWWKHATSPVEDISTPSEGSAPGRRLNENCGTFTPTNGSFCCLSHCSTAEGGLALIIALVARLVKSMSSTLEEKGIEREARTLVSITLSSSAAVWSTCMLRGPVISSFFAILKTMSLRRAKVSGLILGAGSTSDASPECTPPCSMCSEMAKAMTTPLSATASMSISSAPSINLEITTGASSDTSTARSRKPLSSLSERTTFIAAPDST
mmetsp:Transcript_31242/g.45696  ORF Transcript_31242/g.45696 Transcript_31242/m.45696 type:complete len:210 (+) Transcript_31242:732-1361(+)